ncbi:AraC-type DNA-binding protein [Algibacter lectus]|uniref:AraC family transcriptional regulator n=1 Tax=Algibacter lectus TaxID=221126 RepID=UPI0008EF1C81|nr:AraC family transcriptional regulator [Algibacter lectus]SFB86819.1 AraC-type DNA-binding protein [Algibacter lectus]
MKILPFKIPKPEDDGLVFQIDKTTLFYDKLHQHEEIQVSLIIEGEGTLVIGDSINQFGKGDILIIGSNLPHVFKNDDQSATSSQMYSLFFTKTSFGNHFFELEELKELQPFFKRSKHGFKATSHIKLIKEYFFKLEDSSKFKRFIILLELLKITSKSHYKSLSSFVYEKEYSDNEGYRMRNVFEFTMNNFNQDITLNTIAEIANMTKNAFCKYFKKRTNKTYIQFLNELRIEQACKLLLANNDFSIIEIAEASGFKNISNFNRQFKAIKKVNPSEYKHIR